MSLISKEKKDKISEHILSVLFDNFSKPLFTAQIAKEIARDEEFTKDLLTGLDQQRLIVSIIKNPKGIEYIKRIRWRLSNKAHEAYSKHQ